MISSTFIQPQYRTNVPGKARLSEESDDPDSSLKIFSRRSGGDILTQMTKEEYDIRKAGGVPSPEFMENKRRLVAE